MAMTVAELKPVVEAMLMASEQPLSIERLGKLVNISDDKRAGREALRETLSELQSDYASHGIELVEVASGFRFQARADFAEQVGRLFEERRPRYSRAFMETLAIIAYRQPITRGEIEHIRGVAVSSNIMRQLLEREWVKVVGHRDVPGRPAVFATTAQFLDYFSLSSLDELPPLSELKDFDAINPDLFGEVVANAEGSPADAKNETEDSDAEDSDAEDMSPVPDAAVAPAERS